MKILLLGSTGVIGTAIEAVCAAKGIPCAGLSHADLEITDTAALREQIEKHSPDAVVNAVVYMGINPCEENPERAFAVNATAALNLARNCNERGIILIQPSSHAVFDGTKDDYYTENDRPAVTSVYSGSKYLSERFVSDICEKRYVIRFPAIFGPRRNRTPGFVDKMIERIQKGLSLKVADDKIDSPTYSRDAAEAVIGLLTDGRPFGLYHIANSGRVSYFDFISRLVELMGANIEIVRAKDADFPALGYKPLKTAMKSVKLPPLRSWEQALKEYIKTIPQQL